ncbi:MULTISPECIES: hypothetical protein [Erythrobacter]|uniref:Uncharacterized protein n=1 Tax=Erythrobacter aureus TaxID=2182384 RepID=A0A345YH38_9SPHN|nr:MULTISPECIES: hypothetical protein [Erythrobacter]AXK43240.1 hypothetical protein DVR09_13750 [Erythrobacter aureus]MAS04808.1 hypothetical protein [Ahrensia sp.]MBQ95438.1 hypothetical protein [Actinomycetota bacterium]MCF8883821.1 hypothetical protein [Erythrobacter sp. SN021]
MTPERRKLKRAHLIQRIRTVERMQSAVAASEAEATRARLLGVAERTRSLAAHYAHREGDLVGADLRSGKAMRDQLQKLTELSAKQAEEAEAQSQARREVLAQSDMRLRKAKESTRDLVRTIIAGLEKG